LGLTSSLKQEVAKQQGQATKIKKKPYLFVDLPVFLND